VLERVGESEALAGFGRCWHGAWADSIDESPKALRAGVDFVLLRHPPALESAREHAAVPAFWPAPRLPLTAENAVVYGGAGYWRDLRGRATPSA
jgi:hypothetical protein